MPAIPELAAARGRHGLIRTLGVRASRGGVGPLYGERRSWISRVSASTLSVRALSSGLNVVSARSAASDRRLLFAALGSVRDVPASHSNAR